MFHIHIGPVTQPVVPAATPAAQGSGRGSPPAASSDGSATEATAALGMAEELGFSVGAVSVQVITGHIRLFREHGIPVGDAVGRSRTLCVIAVPSHLSVAQFVLFVGPFAAKIEHMRILRDCVHGTGRYMVLVRFSAQDAADGFYRGVHGKPFSSFDRERAHVVYVAQVRLQGDAASAETASFASTLLPTDPLAAPGLRCSAYQIVAPPGGEAAVIGVAHGGADDDRLAAATPHRADAGSPSAQPASAATGGPELTSAPPGAGDGTLLRVGFETYTETPAVTVLAAAAPTSLPAAAAAASEDVCVPLPPSTTPSPVSIVAGMLTELPTCPVCLDRLDTSSSGVVTTLCNHSFHCECLSRWEDDTCPVCRYCLGGEEGEEAATAACEVCGVHDNLWMCLLCGHVGCGRYSHEHALEHFRNSGHTYSIELATQRVRASHVKRALLMILLLTSLLPSPVRPLGTAGVGLRGRWVRAPPHPQQDGWQAGRDPRRRGGWGQAACTAGHRQRTARRYVNVAGGC